MQEGLMEEGQESLGKVDFPEGQEALEAMSALTVQDRTAAVKVLTGQDRMAGISRGVLETEATHPEIGQDQVEAIADRQEMVKGRIAAVIAAHPDMAAGQEGILADKL